MIIWSLTDESNEQVAKSGEVEIGLIRQSASGQWRWEIVNLPGMFRFRDDTNGWEDSESAAKHKVVYLYVLFRKEPPK